MHKRPLMSLVGLFLLGAVGCTDNTVNSDEAARRAYLGLDNSIEKSLNLGFAGFNAATSANIAPQTTTGTTTGMLTVTGQVDQGSRRTRRCDSTSAWSRTPTAR